MFTIVYSIFQIYLTIASTSLIFRRLHDSGRSGWWYLTPLIAIIIFSLIVYFNTDVYDLEDINRFKNLSGVAILFLVISLLGFVIVFILMFYKSDPEENKWGRSPEKSYEFLEASKKYFVEWLDFKSRSRRSEYWWTYLTLLLIVLVEMIILGFIGGV